jgi:hypothetical protein
MLPKLNRADNMSNRMIAGDCSIFHDEPSGMREILTLQKGKLIMSRCSTHVMMSAKRDIVLFLDDLAVTVLSYCEGLKLWTRFGNK